jgi:hypothetical protein
VRQHQILEGIRWIPSDTSGGVLGRGLTQVISVNAGWLDCAALANPGVVGVQVPPRTHSLHIVAPNGTAMAALSGMLLSEPAVGEHSVTPDLA